MGEKPVVKKIEIPGRDAVIFDGTSDREKNEFSVLEDSTSTKTIVYNYKPSDELAQSAWGFFDKYFFSGGKESPVLKILFVAAALLILAMFYHDIALSSPLTSWSIIRWFLIKCVFVLGIFIILYAFFLVFNRFGKRK